MVMMEVLQPTSGPTQPPSNSIADLAIQLSYAQAPKAREEQINKRKEQNKRSQRAYRDRQNQRENNLERRVRELEQQLEQLRTDQHKLLQRLVKVSSENNDLRNKPGNDDRPTSRGSISRTNGEMILASPAGATSFDNNQMLFEAFFAIWTVVNTYSRGSNGVNSGGGGGDIDVGTLLERLQTMIKDHGQIRRGRSRSSSRASSISAQTVFEQMIGALTVSMDIEPVRPTSIVEAIEPEEDKPRS